mmetsp:Transcript_43996/g.71587  ORF Transcript_43996/g.71587 Transcript_43996/m.71587 type:complete len:130 (-) Transcript_43996:61-450(-)
MQILLVRRAKSPNKGVWALPGGVIKVGETTASAGRREVLEETGIQCQIGDSFGHTDGIFKDLTGDIQYHYVLVQLAAFAHPGQTPCAADDASLAQWIPLSKIDSLSPLSETSLQAAKRCIQLLRLGLLC